MSFSVYADHRDRHISTVIYDGSYPGKRHLSSLVIFQESRSPAVSSRGDNDIITLREHRLVQTEGFPDEPFDPVSLDCIPDSLADSNPQSRDSPSILHHRDGEMVRMKFPAESI